MEDNLVTQCTPRKTRDPQFQATALWNRLLLDFRSNMPLKRHRRQLSFFDRSFTGKEAVDFLMTILPKHAPEGKLKQITRENCSMLLQKYLDSRVFKKPRMASEKDVFRENATLYVFCDDDEAGFAGSRTPTLVRRASFCGSADRATRRMSTALITPSSWSKPVDSLIGIKVMTPEEYLMRPQSPRWGEFKTFDLPRSPLKHNGNINRRLSSSHGNLFNSTSKIRSSVHLPPPKFDPDEWSLAETVDSVCAEVNYEQRTPPVANVVPPPQLMQSNKEVGGRALPTRSSTKECVIADSTRLSRYRSSSKALRMSSHREDTQETAECTLRGENMTGKIEMEKKPVIHSNRPQPVDAAAAWGVTVSDDAPSCSTTTRPVFSPLSKRLHSRHSATPKVEKEKDDDYGIYGLFVRRKGTPKNESSRKVAKSERRRHQSGNGNGNRERSIHRTPSLIRSPSADYAPLQIRPRFMTEIDVWSIWAQCLRSRLTRLMGVDSLPFDGWEMSGQDVKWNCEQIGESGVVRPRDGGREFFSGLIKKTMVFLQDFPFPAGSGSVIRYEDQQEVKMFRTLCDRIRLEKPPLDNSFAHAIISVVEHFKRKGRRNGGSSSVAANDMQLETEFSSTTPTTRVVCRKMDSLDDPSNLVQRHFSLPQPGISYADATSPAVGSAKRMEKMMSPIDYSSVLRLPGLVHSPELLERLNQLMGESPGSLSEDKVSLPSVSSPIPPPPPFILDSPQQKGATVTSTGTVQNIEERVQPIVSSRLSTSRISSRMARSPFVSTISPYLEEAMLEAVSLILIALPTNERRRLHYLIRFMGKLCANHCLQLDPQKENRYAVLEGLSEALIDCDGTHSISTVQCLHLVTFLVDCERLIFPIPHGLRNDVELAIRERKREKVTVLNSSEKRELNKENSGEKAYCERIAISDYDAQKSELDRNIAHLLEQIINDPNISKEFKKKKLKTFKKMYPEVYSSRFPNDTDSKEPNLLQRLFRVKNN